MDSASSAGGSTITAPIAIRRYTTAAVMIAPKRARGYDRDGSLTSSAMFAAASKPRNEKNATMDAANAPCNGGTSSANCTRRVGSPLPVPKKIAAQTTTITRPDTSMIEATMLAVSDSRTPCRLMRVRTTMKRTAVITGGTSRNTVK